MRTILAGGYAYGLLRSSVSALKENAALERRWRAEREARVQRIAKEHPDMGLDLLAERFGCEEHEIRRALKKIGIKRERDMISSWAQARHRYNRFGT